MGMTESISIFSNRTIAKNASTVLATPLNMQRFGPNDKFYPDLSASGGGKVAVNYMVGISPDDTFFEPGTASNIGIQKSSVGAASRDLHPAFAPLRSPWMTFKAHELNASPVAFSFNLIVVKE